MTKLINSSVEQAPLQNAHPNIDLARATRRLIELKNATDKVRFDRINLVQALGFKPESGAANPVVSALIHFGFLRREETDYIYTDLGNQLSSATVGSKEYHKLIEQALFNPELYKWLGEKYKNSLPDEIDDILIGKYYNRNITSKNVKGIVNNYLKSVTFATNETNGEARTDEYVPVSFRGNTIPIYKKYLLEAVQRTREDELAKINESLK